MEKEKVLLNATLCFLVRNRRVILAIKADKIGKGYWNGYGGGIEDGELIRKAAARELNQESEEVVVAFEDLIPAAIVDFHNTKSDGETFVCRVYVYLAYKWSGEPKETREMLNPTEFDIDNLPFENMMLADKEWLPPVLNGEKIIASAEYGPWQKELLGPVKIKRVEEFSENF